MPINYKEWTLLELAEMFYIQTELCNSGIYLLTCSNSSIYILKIMFHYVFSLLKIKKDPHVFQSLGKSSWIWTAVFISPISIYFNSKAEHHDRQQIPLSCLWAWIFPVDKVVHVQLPRGNLTHTPFMLGFHSWPSCPFLILCSFQQNGTNGLFYFTWTLHSDFSKHIIHSNSLTSS